MEFAERYGPWALVTGASAGIGREFARALAHRGLPAVLVARRAERLEELCGELRADHGVECRALPLDLLDPACLEQLRDALPGTDVGLLINNAGFGFSGAFLDQDQAAIRNMVRLNTEVPAALARELLPPMVARGRGGMVILASTAAFQATPWMSLYGATKTFDLHLGEGLAVELRGTGVDVLSLCPGHTQSEFHAVSGAPGPAAGGAADARAVVEQALSLLGRRSVVVHGGMNRLLVQGQRLVPRSWTARAAGRLLGRRLSSNEESAT